MEHTTNAGPRNVLTAHEISLTRVASEEWEAWVTAVSITAALCVVTIATYLLRLSRGGAKSQSNNVDWNHRRVP